MVVIEKSYMKILEYLEEDKYTIIAGGTDIMVKKRRTYGLVPDIEGNILLIHQCEELQKVYEDQGGIHIGALCRLEDLLHWPIVPDVLKAAIHEMASPGIRHVGTIGGNIGNASPAGDTLPVLYALNAMLVIESVNGERVIPIQDFIVGPGRTILRDNEIIKEIIIEDHKEYKYFYKKIGPRKSDAISKLSFVGMYHKKQNTVMDVRIAFGAVAKTVVRDEMIEGIACNELSKGGKDYSKVVHAYEHLIRPIDDQRSNKDYRKWSAVNILNTFLNSIGGE